MKTNLVTASHTSNREAADKQAWSLLPFHFLRSCMLPRSTKLQCSDIQPYQLMCVCINKDVYAGCLYAKWLTVIRENP
jgi:hypothetical protein